MASAVLTSAGGGSKRDARIEIGGRNADVSGGRGEVPLRGANVGAPPEQVGRKAGWNGRRNRNDLRAGELRCEGFGRGPGQNAKRVDFRFGFSFEDRDGRSSGSAF